MVVLLFGQECLVYGEEDGSSWRGSLVSGERRRFMMKVLVLSRERDGGKRPVRFLELLMGKEVALGREGVEVCFAPDACSTLREGVYTWEKV